MGLRMPPKPRRLVLKGLISLSLVVVSVVLFSRWTTVEPQRPPVVPLEVECTYEYPDSFCLRSEYYQRFAIQERVIKRGDNLYAIFQDEGLPTSLIATFKERGGDFGRLARLLPGDRLRMHVSQEDKSLTKLVHSSVDGSEVIYWRDPAGWRSRKTERDMLVLNRTASGSIDGNLYDSCVGAGLPAGLVMEMADILACEVDFTTDLRQNDRFSVFFEQAYNNGRRAGSGKILACELDVDGQEHRAYYYDFPKGRGGYYTDEGESVTRMFLKAPLSYRRISSTFSYSRFHPILKRYRPHLGIDYAAPVGTPVSALGDGKVVFIGWKGGYGRFVAIKHNGQYQTTYAHLRSYAKGVKKGTHVERGQVIGYVGTSGLATGPHLDFRFFKDGKPINFLATPFPRAQSIPKGLMEDFQKCRVQYLAALQGKRYAMNDGAANTGH